MFTNKKIKKVLIFNLITTFYALILYYLVFYIFSKFNDYALCTRIELLEISFSSFELNYLYTRSCDEAPYFAVLENIKNLYTIDDFQYRNRPIFLLIAYSINKIISFFFGMNQSLFVFQLSYLILQIFILSITTVILNNVINIKNTYKNYSLTLLMLTLSPIFKWTLFEAGSHTQTGIVFLLGIYLFKNSRLLDVFSLHIILGFMYLSHRSFIVLYLYVMYLIFVNNNTYKLIGKKCLKSSLYFFIPILSYEIFKYFFTSGEDHNIEVYNQFFWVFDYLRGVDTNGVTGWYCQEFPQNFICYFKDNIQTIKYLYIPVIFIILYLIKNKNSIFKSDYWRPLFEMFILINLFWSFIGWYPPVRFSFYSWGHLIIFILIIIYYDLKTTLQKIIFIFAHVLFFTLLNHYNADYYLQPNIWHISSAILFFLVLILDKRNKMINYEN
tara:strand:- start:10708 stop:12030 length:1323 start_codon:yes stop_codon:yes gene_type:complete